MKKAHAYGHAPSHIPPRKLALGWLKCIHRFKSHRGAKTYWHSHDETQLLCTLFGEFAYEFKDRPKVLLSAGQCIVIPANTPHRLVKMQDVAGRRVEMLLSCPPPGKASRSGRDAIPAAVVRSLLKAMTANPCRAVQCRREYLALFDEMYELAGRGESLTAEEIALARVLASMIVLEFPRQNCRRKSVPARADRADIADKLIAFMEAHYKEQLSISRLCSYGGYSRSATIAMIQNATGKCPGELLADMRMEEAARLLSNTDRAVSGIARECGYSSARYFNYVFRRKKGATPSAWRLAGR